MKVGEIDIKWDMGYEAAADLLEAIQTVVGSAGIRKVEGENFKVEKLGDHPNTELNIYIDGKFYEV